MTQLHAGREIRTRIPTRSLVGFTGVGVSVVNALSDWLELRIWRGRQGACSALRGAGFTVEHLKVVGDAGGDRTGTRGCCFLASTSTFSNLELLVQDARRPASRTRLS